MSTPCDGLAAGLWVDGKRSVGKRNYKDLNDRYNEVSRSNYKIFKEKYKATDNNYKAN